MKCENCHRTKVSLTNIGNFFACEICVAFLDEHGYLPAATLGDLKENERLREILEDENEN